MTALPLPRELDLAPASNRCGQCSVRHLTVCSAIEDRDLWALSAVTRRKKFHAGETIFTEKDPVSHVYNISAGTVRLIKLLPNGRRQITGFLFPGQFLGPVFNATYSYGAEAITAATLCQFEQASFHNFADRFPGIKDRLLLETNQALTLAHEQMLLLGRKTPTEKLASFLLWLAAQDRHDKLTHDKLAKDGIRLAMSREDIADYLGLTIETVSRTFTRLKVANVIGLPQRHRVIIHNRVRLQEIAEGS